MQKMTFSGLLKRYFWLPFVVFGCERGCNSERQEVLAAKAFPVQVGQQAATLKVQKVNHTVVNTKWNGRIGMQCRCSHTVQGHYQDFAYSLQLPNRPELLEIYRLPVSYSTMVEDTSLKSIAQKISFKASDNQQHFLVSTDSGLAVAVYHLLPKGSPFLSEYAYNPQAAQPEDRTRAETVDLSKIPAATQIAWDLLRKNERITDGKGQNANDLFVNALSSYTAPSEYDFYLVENMATKTTFFEALSSERIREAAANSPKWRALAVSQMLRCLRKNESASEAQGILFALNAADLYAQADQIYLGRWFDPDNHFEASTYFERRAKVPEMVVAESVRKQMREKAIKNLHSNGSLQKEAFAYLLDLHEVNLLQTYFDKHLASNYLYTETITLAQTNYAQMPPETQKLIIQRAKKLIMKEEDWLKRRTLLQMLAGHVDCEQWAVYRKNYDEDLRAIVFVDSCR
ncbi:hypothetical protein SAMN05421780_102200 [Flexibacter flexilis DSM 6793]|uniref:Uncharacterized protein n=1 Tax=Flexibacter flexilis DSM 6793 TaxID=927664 RepID=A0A1I1FHN5_9BACT|nr:hypothetical protein [Flexibacter flexilis]SFB99009.1 hypothetical protein SAMN05421780_102200 [Flexibacter flexilis DSM 6793]